MKKHQLCCIGHITLDKVVTPQSTVYMPGGTAFYCSHAIRHFNDIDYLKNEFRRKNQRMQKAGRFFTGAAC